MGSDGKVILLMHTKNQKWIANAIYSYNMFFDYIIQEFVAGICGRNMCHILYDFQEIFQPQ